MKWKEIAKLLTRVAAIISMLGAVYFLFVLQVTAIGGIFLVNGILLFVASG